MKKLKITVVSFEEFTDDEFIPPAAYYIMDSLQNYNFIHTRSRQEALDYIKSEYGGKYALCTARQSKGSGSLTCTGVGTRKGQKAYN